MAYPANLRGWGPGWPTNRSSDMATIRAAKSGARFTVHRDIAPIVKYLIDEVEARGYLIDHGPGDVDDDWSYANRPIRGRNVASNHSWGLAIDINAQDFPLGSSKRLPQWIVDLFTDLHFEYGGDWSGRKDPMHFEFAGSRGQAQWIAASLGAHAVEGSKPRPPASVPPVFTPAISIEEDDMHCIIICEGKGIAHVVTGGRFSTITVDELKLIREAYKRIGQPLLEMNVTARRWAQLGLG